MVTITTTTAREAREFVTLTEAARISGYSQSSLTKRIARGALQRYPPPAEWGTGANRPSIAILRDDALRLRRIMRLEGELARGAEGALHRSPRAVPA